MYRAAAGAWTIAIICLTWFSWNLCPSEPNCLTAQVGTAIAFALLVLVIPLKEPSIVGLALIVAGVVVGLASLVTAAMSFAPCHGCGIPGLNSTLVTFVLIFVLGPVSLFSIVVGTIVMADKGRDGSV
jgi:hypothetical protein